VVGSHELRRHSSTRNIPDYAIWVNISANRCRLEIVSDMLVTASVLLSSREARDCAEPGVVWDTEAATVRTSVVQGVEKEKK
jgi:hypothetical protein